MSEDLKSKVIETIDSLIQKGQNSLDLRTADMVYGITKAKEAVEKLFNTESTHDCVSRQAAIEAVHEEFDECLVWDESGQTTADEVERILYDLPSVQPERKKGMWFRIGNTGLATCKCGYITDRYSVYNYCPNCGAEMEKGEGNV